MSEMWTTWIKSSVHFCRIESYLHSDCESYSLEVIYDNTVLYVALKIDK